MNGKLSGKVNGNRTHPLVNLKKQALLPMGSETYMSNIVKSEQIEKDNNHSSNANNDEAVR